MPLFRRLPQALKAAAQLGPRRAAHYAWYQLGRRSGWLRAQTPVGGWGAEPVPALRPLRPLPERAALAACLGPAGQADLLAEAAAAAAGQARLFGAQAPVSLAALAPAATLGHWLAYEQSQDDIKFTWEPARFGWAFALGRAYHLSGDERLAEAFWQQVEAFLTANPPNCGPQWASAQEAALRLIAWSALAPVFAPSAHSTPERQLRLAQAVAAHARRIPPTLAYAQAQNNNHLLSEAAGLYTAALALPEHPLAAGWRRLGWRHFHQGLQAQIAADGAYSQHSANYTRLMLQLAAWMAGLATAAGEPFPAESQARLAAATRWLLALVDPESGRAPNLGPNDGAYIFPLAACPFADYRPAMQAAGQAFLGAKPFPPGLWDEAGLWLLGAAGQARLVEATGGGGAVSAPDQGLSQIRLGPQPLADEHEPRPYDATPSAVASERAWRAQKPALAPLVLHAGPQSWAYLRAARFSGRPGHADQLHLDLWWRGLNVAQDAGTYRYTAAPPWDNALARTAVHNTLLVDGQEQMTWAGRFLWLDWAQAQGITAERAADGSWTRLTAQHTGYRRLGVLHERQVTAAADGGWQVRDTLLPTAGRAAARPHTARLHWLLPDWPWRLETSAERLALGVQSPDGWIELKVFVGQMAAPFDPQKGLLLVRAGQALYGAGSVSPTWGWVAPAYGQKLPALSFSVTIESPLPLTLVSTWQFP
jgi:hypothetical protein